MTKYNSELFKPPAPMAEVILRNPDAGMAWAEVPMLIDLIFCRRTFHGQYLLIDQSWGILGRNVLNFVPIILDGPNLKWDEYRPI